ncbi:hypothetical protein SAY87_020527 [Trapa incisa]|uniref:Uncharacterized protein n=1 Tax=Trapa incisa TaxID=236973 RepID=A0AAN7PP92_9MYRT|nr:hypothetical protein SAY87_020527 [Trapa incisa]
MGSSSTLSLSIELDCKSRVSEIGVPVPCHRTAFSVTFEIHHHVRLTRLYNGSGDTVETKTHAVNATTAEFRCIILIAGGTSRISQKLMELEVPLAFHQSIIVQIRGAAMYLLTRDMYVPGHAIYPMTVKIDRQTHRIVYLREGEEIEADEREQQPKGGELEVPVVAEPAVKANDDDNIVQMQSWRLSSLRAKKKSKWESA